MNEPPNHLIIVCGHGIYLGGPQHGHDEENEWLIEPYKKGETPTFIAHIKAGCSILNSDSRSMLVFSGAPTRPETPLSEARSYYNLAVDNNLVSPELLNSRILVEDRALDSYFNILFSMVLYWRHHPLRHWPERLTIVSHEFKRNRIVNGHCAAIGFPLDKVDYVGINPPTLKSEDEGSNQLTLGQWERDPHGASEELAGKRSGRNHWGFNQQLFLDKDEEREAGMEGLVRVLDDWSETLVDCETRRPWGGK